MTRPEFRADLRDWQGDRKQYGVDLKAYNAALPQYQTALDQYQKDKLAFEEATKKYGVDRPVYDAYTAAYGQRMQNTPMYNQAQFMGPEQTYTPTWNDQLASPVFQYSPPPPSAAISAQAAGPRFFKQTGFGKNATYEAFTPEKAVNMSNFMYDPAQGGYVLKRSNYGSYGYAKGGKVDGEEGSDSAYDTEDNISDEEYLDLLIKARQNRARLLAKEAGPLAIEMPPEDQIGDLLSKYYSGEYVPETFQAEPEVIDPESADAAAYGDASTNIDELLSKYEPAAEPAVEAAPEQDVAALAEKYQEPEQPAIPADVESADAARYRNISDEIATLLGKYQPEAAGMDTVETPFNEPTEVSRPETVEQTAQATPTPGSTPMSPAANDLMEMLGKYVGQESVYAPELKAARARADKENEAFQKLIADSMKPDTAPPDRAEMYFRLAAAFGSPTKTGHISENLGLVGKELSEYAKDIRTSKKAEKQQRMQLALEAQKLKAQAAKEELGTLRALTAEEMKDRREIMKDYIKSGMPQSEAGKIARDMGLAPGSKEEQAFIKDYVQKKLESGDWYKQMMAGFAAQNLQIKQSAEQRAVEQTKKLSPAEIKMKSESEDLIANAKQSLADLKEAYRLNPNSLAGGWLEKGQQFLYEAAGSNDPVIVNTRVLNNLLGSQGLAKMRSIFGGNPTEGERAILLELEGIGSKTKEERAAIIKRTYKVLQDRVAREERRLKDISSGMYRSTTPIEGEE